MKVDRPSTLRFGALVLAFVPFLIQVFAEGTGTCRSLKEEICSSTADYHTFCDSLYRVDLDEMLDDTNYQYTVFLPTTTAFHALFDDCGITNIDGFDDETLEDLLLLHIHKDGILDKEDLEDRCSNLLLMENGDNTRTICSNPTDSQIFQKGGGNPSGEAPRVTSFDIHACNGIIHVMDGVILPGGFQCPSPTRKPTPAPTEHLLDAACSAHPACSALVGDCCPTPDNTFLACCPDTHSPTRAPTPHPTVPPTSHPTNTPANIPTPQPTRNPTKNPTKMPTRAPTNQPTPSPTTHIEDAACSAHPECAARGLTGDCCPTDEDKRLDCCSNTHLPTPSPTNKPPTPSPTNKPTIDYSDSSCAAYPACSHLEGECCPTDDGLKLECCFEDSDDQVAPTSVPIDSCSANPRCSALGLEGDCCPADDAMKLDCCFDEVPGTCSQFTGCAELGLEGDCCPAPNGINLACCDVEMYGLPIIYSKYCDDALDFSCYKFGKPECCLKSSKVCPKEKPECEVGFPIIGESYCTYAPKFGCYENGWPKCCSENPAECPRYRPDCELGTLFKTGLYCGDSPDFRCYELGYPPCCLTNDESCPYEEPECNIAEKGCDEDDSILSIYDFACSQRNFDILCELIQESELEDLLKESGTLTLFAPSNEAFEDLGEEVLANLLEDPTGELKDILKYHISDEIYFESDLYCNRQIDTLLGDTSDDSTTTKCKARGAYQKGKGNQKPYPRIRHTDMVTCNGVVHVVDKVILPN